MRPEKIVVISSTGRRVGSAVHCQQLLARYVALGVPTTAVVPTDDEWLSEAASGTGGHVVRVAKGPILRVLELVWKLWREDANHALLHAHGRSSLLALRGYGALAPWRRVRSRTAYTIHQAPNLSRAGPVGLLSLAETLALSWVSRRWFVSPWVRDIWYQTHHIPQHSTVVYGSQVIPVGEPESDRESDISRGRADGRPLSLLYIGRLAVEKGPERLIPVMRRLIDSGVDCTIDIVGDGPLWSEMLAFRSEFPERVRLHGWIGNPVAFLRSADLLLVPSRSEAFGLVVLEALKAYVPVIVSADGPMGTLIDGVGAAVDFDDSDAVRSAIVRWASCSGDPDFPLRVRGAIRDHDSGVVSDRDLAAFISL